MKQCLICKNCKAVLSSSIEILSGKDPNVEKPEFVDDQSVSPVGTGYKSYEPYRKSYDDNPAPLEFTPQIWMNIDDLTDHTDITTEASRLNGCCGLDGCDGPNIICNQCKKYVGTQMSDCWTSYLFIPEPNATEWKEK